MGTFYWVCAVSRTAACDPAAAERQFINASLSKPVRVPQGSVTYLASGNLRGHRFGA